MCGAFDEVLWCQLNKISASDTIVQLRMPHTFSGTICSYSHQIIVIQSTSSVCLVDKFSIRWNFLSPAMEKLINRALQHTYSAAEYLDPLQCYCGKNGDPMERVLRQTNRSQCHVSMACLNVSAIWFVERKTELQLQYSIATDLNRFLLKLFFAEHKRLNKLTDAC